LPSTNRVSPPSPAPNAAAARRRRKLLFLVTEDWYFWSHRLPVARAARDAGFEVCIATRVRDHGAPIAAEGFRLCPLRWRRRGDGIVRSIRALWEIAALYRRERPDIVHHVALKPVLFGGFAACLAFPRAPTRPKVIAAVAGFGSGLAAATPFADIARQLMRWALRLAMAGARIIVQNPEDGAALQQIGIAVRRITLIRGSGVDTSGFPALPDPPALPVQVALVSRMLRSKGIPDAVAAVRRLRAEGLAVELLLVGPTDPDNRDSLTDAELAAFASEPGIAWLGRVDDVPAVWRRAAIAVLPSIYGEGVPKALIEAAACARPIVATDMPGCREIVRHGETGLLVPPGDAAALAAAIAALVGDPQRRAEMGRTGRALAEREFSEESVARQTLALYQALLNGRKAPQ
jgi:glycosyltransferase involved in cell wall biosynthesis